MGGSGGWRVTSYRLQVTGNRLDLPLPVNSLTAHCFRSLLAVTLSMEDMVYDDAQGDVDVEGESFAVHG